jgi:hypothetical protein
LKNIVLDKIKYKQLSNPSACGKYFYSDQQTLAALRAREINK